MRGWIVFAACGLSLLSAMARAQTTPQQQTEIPCESTKLAIKLTNPKCWRLPDSATVSDNRPGRFVPGAINVTGESGFGRASMQARIPPDTNVFIIGTKEADVPRLAQAFNEATRSGENWSPVRIVGNAWVMTFQSASSACFYFENYGPYYLNGYAWGVRGAVCRSGAAFSDPEMKEVLGLVVAK